ncbi:hypothetical protein RGU11_00790 [Rossellomorea marisflavi]|uniref:hypothetical protein n=1 Tax=Rossellomorea marisflavi TaxID=189381 RepID=UPI002852F9F9|nr:hypothetical protein [Rossellomorea marisflavi]MDR4934909.1 hypothetical protein [Rossellomorea marisflavi]
MENGRNIVIGGNVAGNPNINTGDDVVQTNISHEGLSDKAFKQLFEDISEKCNGATSDQMKFFAEKLQEAYQKQDKEEGRKLLGFLQGTLGNIGSIASIASLFGIAL